MFAQSLEEGMDWLDVSRRARIEHDHIVEVRRNLIQTLGNLANGLDKPSRRWTAALRHNQPLVKAPAEMRNAVSGTVSLCAVI